MSNPSIPNTCPKCGAPIPAEAPGGLCPRCVLAGAATATDTGLPPAGTAEIPSIERVAAAFPQLEVIELIGRGGMGFVFKARQPHLDRFVALKLLPDKLARDPRFTERFNREGRVLAKLNHPNIVTVFDFGQTEHFYFLLMEYVDGVNLRQAMQAGRFSPAEALGIVPKICEALQYAHEQGILHRDIKPENILLDGKGRVKIADFGIAKLVGDEKPDISLTATGAAIGTPQYMAPEQIEKPASVDHRADIYSLGVVFYEMLTGELPIGRFAAPSTKTPVGAGVDEVVFRTLEKDRERRYQSAGEMKTSVEHLTGGGASALPSRASGAAGPHGTVVLNPPGRSWGRILAWIALVLCMINFLAPHVTRLGNSPADTVTVGLTQPWLVWVPRVDAAGVVHRELRTNFRSTAFYSGFFALALGAGLLVFRRPSASAGYSGKAIWGAVLTGLSLPVPLLLVIVATSRLGGIGLGEIGLTVVLGFSPALLGVILGWVALSDIRANAGKLHGLPLAVFAALMWPLLLLVGVTVSVPLYLLQQATGVGEAGALSRFLLAVVPAGTLTFAIWAVYAATRWGANQPSLQRRGILKWVFVALLALGVAAVFTALDRPPSQKPDSANTLASLPEETVELVALSRDPSDGAWWRPDGTPANEGAFQRTGVATQVKPGERAVLFIFRSRELERRTSSRTYEIEGARTWIGGGPPRQSGRSVTGGSFVVATFPENLRATTVRVGVAIDAWETAAQDSGTASRTLSFSRHGQTREVAFYGATEDKSGDTILTLTHDLPEEDVRILAVDGRGREHASTTRYSTGERHKFTIPRLSPQQAREYRFQVRPYRWAEFKNVQLAPGASESARAPLSNPRATTNSEPWMRFTITAVELREVNGARWLAFDYIDDVRGDCEKSFPWENKIPGFTAETRTTGFIGGEKDAPIRHQRVEYRMPDSAPRDHLLKLRDQLEQALKTKSFRLGVGEKKLLFEIGSSSDTAFKAWIKVVPPQRTPP